MISFLWRGSPLRRGVHAKPMTEKAPLPIVIGKVSAFYPRSAMDECCELDWSRPYGMRSVIRFAKWV